MKGKYNRIFKIFFIMEIDLVLDFEKALKRKLLKDLVLLGRSKKYLKSCLKLHWCLDLIKGGEAFQRRVKLVITNL